MVGRKIKVMVCQSDLHSPTPHNYNCSNPNGPYFVHCVVVLAINLRLNRRTPPPLHRSNKETFTGYRVRAVPNL
jgi:hypothetical protein